MSLGGGRSERLAGSSAVTLSDMDIHRIKDFAQRSGLTLPSKNRLGCCYEESTLGKGVAKVEPGWPPRQLLLRSGQRKKVS